VATRTVELARARGVPAWVIGEVVRRDSIGGERYAEAAM
jgi:hypothetical protein